MCLEQGSSPQEALVKQGGINHEKCDQEMADCGGRSGRLRCSGVHLAGQFEKKPVNDTLPPPSCSSQGGVMVDEPDSSISPEKDDPEITVKPETRILHPP